MTNRVVFWNISTTPSMSPDEYVVLTGDAPMSTENFKRVVNLGKRRTAYKLVLRRYTDLADNVSVLMERIRKIMDAGIEIEARESQTLSDVLHWYAIRHEPEGPAPRKPTGRPGIPREAVDEILSAYDDGYTVGDIHKFTGRPQSTISQVLKRMRPDREGIHRHRKPKDTVVNIRHH